MAIDMTDIEKLQQDVMEYALNIGAGMNYEEYIEFFSGLADGFKEEVEQMGSEEMK